MTELIEKNILQSLIALVKQSEATTKSTEQYVLIYFWTLLLSFLKFNFLIY